MSEFYKENRDKIMKEYKYLGIGQRIFFWFFRGLEVIFLIVSMHCLVDVERQGRISENLGIMGIVLVVAIVCYFISKSEKKKHKEDKIAAVDKFIKEPDINIDVIQKLIEEIEKYNKKVKIFASWIAGLAATFIILLITVITDYIYKIFDILVRTIPESELIEGIEGEFMDNKFFSKIASDFFSILLLLCIIILSIYFIFSIFTFVKEQILIFLYDAQYKMLSKGSKDNESMERCDVEEKRNESVI